MNAILRFLWPIAAAALAGCATAPPQSAVAQHRQMFVTAANPLAAKAGMAVLRRGGSAIDAAIAVEAMLSLVEPRRETSPSMTGARRRRPAPRPTCSSTTMAIPFPSPRPC
jgi:hypothetical protein